MFGYKVSRLSYIRPAVSNKEGRLIRGSTRTEGSGREGTKNEIRKILWS